MPSGEHPDHVTQSGRQSRPPVREGVIKDWKVPGLAVAVVKDDQVAFSEGFGLRDVKRNFLVTRDTLFAIGSSSKAFTVMSLGLLVEDGKLDWDRPARLQYLEPNADFRERWQYQNLMFLTAGYLAGEVPCPTTRRTRPSSRSGTVAPFPRSSPGR